MASCTASSPPLPTAVWQVEEPVFRASLYGLYGLGRVMVVRSTFMISHTDLFGLKQDYANLRGTQATPPEFQKRFLYRYVRHSIALGFVVAFWAIPEMTAGHLRFAVASTGYILVGIALEERDLLDVHEETYADYRSEVPMLLPLGRRKSK